MKSKLFGSTINGVIAIAAFAGLATSCVTTSSTNSADMGECHGINSCKGQGACGGKSHSCAGKNSCKGKGWLKMSNAECNEQGGKFKAG